MSILIKGTDMPQNCAECPCSCSLDDWAEPSICRALREQPEVSDTGRLSECPLVELPTPHGDLIDRDAVLCLGNVLLNDTFIHKWAVIKVPAIIEAEE